MAGEDQGSIPTLSTTAREPMLYPTMLRAAHVSLHMEGMQGSASQSSWAASAHQVAALSCGWIQGAVMDIRRKGTSYVENARKAPLGPFLQF